MERMDVFFDWNLSTTEDYPVKMREDNSRDTASKSLEQIIRVSCMPCLFQS